MTEPRQKYLEARAQKCVTALQKKGFKSVYCADAAAAKEEVIRLAGNPATVGFGGSLTTRALGLVDYFRNQGCQVFDHWVPGLSKEDSLSIRRSQLTSDVFLASANAVTLDGCIINLDGNGNRVTASIFGPKRIILVVSAHKITKTVEEGITRTRQIASPQNYMRLGVEVPCSITGECINCQMPKKECRVLVIMEGVPKSSPDYHVIIVGEELGY